MTSGNDTPTLEGCTLGHTNRNNIRHLQEQDRMQWEAIRRLQTRLPLWATFIISLLTAACSSLLTYIGVS